MARMKALVKAKPEPGLWLEEVPVPDPGINDVLIKIHRASICGTDVHIYNWDPWAQRHIKTPMVIGHEFAGTVAAVGSNVHDYREGDIVSGEGHLVCGLCRNCLAGRRHLCPNTSGVGVDRTERVEQPATDSSAANASAPAPRGLRVGVIPRIVTPGVPFARSRGRAPVRADLPGRTDAGARSSLGTGAAP